MLLCALQFTNPLTPTKVVDRVSDPPDANGALDECPCHRDPTNSTGGITSCDVVGTQLHPPLPPSPDGVQLCPCHRQPVQKRDDGTVECAKEHAVLQTEEPPTRGP
jgi:hypothetical protein